MGERVEMGLCRRKILLYPAILVVLALVMPNGMYELHIR